MTSDMTRDDWQRVSNPWRVVQAAANDEVARDAALVRIIDTCLEIQLVRRHDNLGYQPFSVTGNVPMPGSGKVVDSTGIAADRMRLDSEWHRSCAWLLGRLPRRQAAAMMLQAARIRPVKVSEYKSENPFMVTASGMIKKQADLLIALGMREHVPTPYRSVEDLQKAASRARKRLRDWLRGEEVEELVASGEPESR